MAGILNTGKTISQLLSENNSPAQQTIYNNIINESKDYKLMCYRYGITNNNEDTPASYESLILKTNDIINNHKQFVTWIIDEQWSDLKRYLLKYSYLQRRKNEYRYSVITNHLISILESSDAVCEKHEPVELTDDVKLVLKIFDAELVTELTDPIKIIYTDYREPIKIIDIDFEEIELKKLEALKKLSEAEILSLE